MKKLFLLLMIAAAQLNAAASVWVGPHFNYTRLLFNTPKQLEGYAGGITVGGEYRYCAYFTNLEYEGTWNAATLNGKDCQSSNIRDFLLDWRIGYTFWWNNFIFKPYLGFGWNRFDNEQDPQSAALTYRYRKLFVPIGFYLYCNRFDCMRAGLQFEYRPDVSTRLTLVSIRLSNRREQAFRVQIPLEYFYCQRTSFALVPFFNWNKFGRCTNRSLVGVPLDIPEATNWSAGLRVLFGIQF